MKVVSGEGEVEEHVQPAEREDTPLIQPVVRWLSHRLLQSSV
jgi:hypothetical protein